MDHSLGVDFQNPLFGHVHLVLSNGLPGCEDLPVHVGQTHPVIVDQVQGTDAAAGQCFHCVAADAADAKHRYPCLV